MFIAVQAEDAENVKDIGQRVMTLAKGIGVGNSITPHAKAIIEAADNGIGAMCAGNWIAPRTAYKQAMNEVHDEKCRSSLAWAAGCAEPKY